VTVSCGGGPVVGKESWGKLRGRCFVVVDTFSFLCVDDSLLDLDLDIRILFCLMTI